MSLSKLTGFTYSKSLIYFLLFTVTFSIFAFSQQSFVLGGRLRPRFSLEFIDFRDQLMWLGKQVHLWSVLPLSLPSMMQIVCVRLEAYNSLYNIATYIAEATRRSNCWNPPPTSVSSDSEEEIFGKNLVLDATEGALAIAHNSFGGTLETRIWVYTLGVMVFFALLKSWVAIRQERNEEHRVWAIRTWGWTGCIFTMRLFMFFLARFILSPHTRDFYSVTTCSILRELCTTHSHPIELISRKHPACENTMLGLSTHSSSTWILSARTYDDDDHYGIWNVRMAGNGTAYGGRGVVVALEC
ncbi:uncharacterized protein EAE98_002612 [Botrytis deweyae]|uniref:Uncharacterized protein n=1 Tax=Botrytis deweyae TaxID=2478750 RepID=A0ABQ7IXM8_9HELO|nr:uncharacterized protein EAE98_002612 [Botrytis deweyae]KAF7936393.1 hypothetical protein EAE98_002612 [Botrytis deweyae]